mmetsp:Transcript_52265/g.156861  ORF Transcript_52265/g.156861 Transcript_52265/m.156861 type:complete len:253 (-) Transcript_52265:208-966(-)
MLGATIGVRRTRQRAELCQARVDDFALRIPPSCRARSPPRQKWKTHSCWPPVAPRNRPEKVVRRRRPVPCSHEHLPIPPAASGTLRRQLDGPQSRPRTPFDAMRANRRRRRTPRRRGDPRGISESLDSGCLFSCASVHRRPPRDRVTATAIRHEPRRHLHLRRRYPCFPSFLRSLRHRPPSVRSWKFRPTIPPPFPPFLQPSAVPRARKSRDASTRTFPRRPIPAFGSSPRVDPARTSPSEALRTARNNEGP